MATGGIDPDLKKAIESDEMPTNTLSMVWLGIKSLIKDNTSMKENIAQLDIRTRAIEETCVTHDESLDSLQRSVRLLYAKLTRSDVIQASLLDEIEDLKSRSMRANLIFSFDPALSDYKESQGEDCVELVRSFLCDILGISSAVYIQSAHRLGRPTSGKSRAIIARIPETAQRSLIFRNRLRDTHHFVSQQMAPPDLRGDSLYILNIKN